MAERGTILCCVPINYTNYAIPDSVTTINAGAFANCSNLISVSIDKNLTKIGASAFFDCSSLTSVTIPEGVTYIGDTAFTGCSQLKSITIPDNVTSLGTSVFSNCSNLASVIIGKGVTSIGKTEFFECPNLISITIPDNVTAIGELAFDESSDNLKIICANGSYAQQYAIQNVIPFASDIKTKPSAVTALPVQLSGRVDNKPYNFNVYEIGGNNYYNLQEIAAALNGTAKQFQIDWDIANNAIRLTRKTSYIPPTGREFNIPATAKILYASVSPDMLYIDGMKIGKAGYTIRNGNYLKLADIARMLNLGVTWNNHNNTVKLSTANDFDPSVDIK